ncbi:GSCOCG00010524001-RA-CDS, partial [Cotesia congregata]
KCHVKGVKGHTVVSKLPLIDLGTCLLPEYMHSALLGVGRQFAEIYVNKKGPWNLKNFLENRLPQKYLEHWMLFVKGLYMLLQGQITKQDIINAKELLTEFVKQTEILYSDRELSYNLHQLIHYPLIVERWGPLKHTSAFSFENFNGFLTHNTHGTKHLGQEIMNHLKIIEGIQVLKNR